LVIRQKHSGAAWLAGVLKGYFHNQTKDVAMIKKGTSFSAMMEKSSF